jgi:Uma2 family endonuclease
VVAVSPLSFPYPIEYPASDGKPMAETDIHRDEMADAIDTLKDRYADKEGVYVAGNLLIYYEEGNPAARFAPDVFVVLGVPKKKRRVYKLWEEGKPPAFVLEVTSRGTRLEDKGLKKELCEELLVDEYFLFDPEGDYLKPPLQGYRLVEGRYASILPAPDGSLHSEVLGLLLKLEEGRLRMIDPAAGVRLLRPDEARQAARDAEARVQRMTKRAQRETKRAQREAERAQREAERAQREAERAQEAEARASAAEAELVQLRALLEKR